MKTENDIDLFGQRRILIANPAAYAAAPGSGPTGKSCKNCAHYTQVVAQGGSVHRKCGLIKTTHGKATDIKASTPACTAFAVPAPTRAEYYGMDAKKAAKCVRACIKSARANLAKACQPYADIDASMESALDDLFYALSKFETALNDSDAYLAEPFE